MRDVEHWLERRTTRGALATLIVLSVLPLRIIDEVFAPMLVVVFSLELFVRVGAHRRVMRREGGSPWAGRILLSIDFLAILSFLPWSTAILPAAESFRLLRLVRLVLLVRYGAQIVRDGWAILTRRERLRHFLIVSASVALMALVASVLLVHLDATTDWDGDGVVGVHHRDRRGLVSLRELLDVAWWCFRQLESGDNLVQTVHEHPLVIVVSLALTVAGLFILAFIIGIGASVLEQLVLAERQKPLGLRNHSIIIGPVHAAEPMVRELARLYAKNRWIAQAAPPGLRGFLSARRGPESRMALLGREEEPPAYIYDAELRTAAYRQGDPADPAALARVDIDQAKRVIVLSHPAAGEDIDAVAVSTVMAIRQYNVRARVYVEIQAAGEASRVASSCGGDRTYPLEMPRLIGLFLCQHLVVPGIDRLYRELLTADGAEIYTHVMNLPWEFEALQRLPALWEDVFLRWEDLVLHAWEKHHVVLFGALLGDRMHSVSAEKLTTHINPYAAPEDERLAKLGAQAGFVPIASLRGFIGLSPTYGELRSAAVAILDGEVPASPPVVEPDHDRPLKLDDGDLRRMLVFGENDALPSMLGETLRFVRSAHVVVVTRAGHDMARRLERLPAIERVEVTAGVWDLRGENDGRIRVFALETLDVPTAIASPLVREEGPYDTIVFLGDPTASDRDARTSMRVLQLTSRIEADEFPVSDHLQVLVEVANSAKGALVAPRLERLRRARHTLRPTFVSTQVLKNYFLVHSAFVPGLPAAYEELLSEKGQEFIRLAVARRWPATPVHFRDLLVRLARHRIIPVAVELRDGSVSVSPHPEDPPFDGAEIAAIFAIGDTSNLAPDALLT